VSGITWPKGAGDGVWEWTSERHVGGEAEADESHERRVVDPARAESSAGGAKPKEAITSNNLLDAWNVDGEDLGGQPGDG
jgi:hypothetical protein